MRDFVNSFTTFCTNEDGFHFFKLCDNSNFEWLKIVISIFQLFKIIPTIIEPNTEFSKTEQEDITYRFFKQIIRNKLNLENIDHQIVYFSPNSQLIINGLLIYGWLNFIHIFNGIYHSDRITLMSWRNIPIEGFIKFVTVDLYEEREKVLGKSSKNYDEIVGSRMESIGKIYSQIVEGAKGNKESAQETSDKKNSEVESSNKGKSSEKTSLKEPVVFNPSSKILEIYDDM
jgi:hypothetical protein